jgi:ribosome-binding factor A
MKPYPRSERINGHIQRVLSNVLQKHVKDPRLEMAIITGVKVSRDLRIARVYFTASGGKERGQEAAEGFKSALGYVKRALAQQLGLRYMPEFKFIYDESFDYGSHIDQVLKSIKTDNGSNNTSLEKE